MENTRASEAREIAGEVAAYLDRRRALLTRRWLRAVRQHMGIRPATRDGLIGLVNQLPRLFTELHSSIACGGENRTERRARREAQEHALERWRQGFALDELYFELDLLERCIQGCVREYFTGASTREGQGRVHEVIEAFFSNAIRSAMRQYQAQADRRVNAALAERDAAELARHRSEQRLRFAADAAGLGIFEWDPATGDAIWENARMYEITGQPAESGPLSVSEFATLLVDSDEAARLCQSLKEEGRSEGQFHSVFCIRRRGAPVPVVVEISAQYMTGHAGGERLVGAMADITRRMEVEDALKEADRRKDIFLATLAHELRNPLAPVVNAAHLLKRGDLPPAQLRWIQGVIERHARHLANLVDDLLDVSRISAGKIHLRKEIVDIRCAIERAIEINAPAAAARGHRLEAPRLDRIPAAFVHGDATRLTQIVSNLIDNAIKYTPDGGHIQLRVKSQDRTIIIEIEDNGIGMDHASIRTMFRLFEQEGRAEGQKAGLGIGLSVTRSLAVMHGGSVRATSGGRGKGSCFIVELPQCDEPVVEPEKRDASVLRVAGLRVMIVDDNFDAAESLAAVVGEVHEVRTAATGEDAMALAREFGPDVAILDLALPGVSGYDVASSLLRAEGPANRIVLIALTGHGQPEDLERTRKAGFDHHLVKPVRPEELMKLLENIAGSR
ncbi:ATP-binding protein [Paraburkholderia tropica]|uniref:hybrid sensor histidine kinase/response regulator n=1 Tax=Paraburkholderia tropica TaxID=92647 RepID=UPI003D29018F